MFEELIERITECYNVIDPRQAATLTAHALYILKTYPYMDMDEVFEKALIETKL